MNALLGLCVVFSIDKQQRQNLGSNNAEKPFLKSDLIGCKSLNTNNISESDKKEILRPLSD